MSFLEYCSNCSDKNIYGHIDGNKRYHCPSCKIIHYQNRNALLCSKSNPAKGNSPTPKPI